MNTRRVVALACIALLSPLPAHARKLVVVLPFEGPHDTGTRMSLSRAIAVRGARLIPFPKYRQTAEQLKVELDSADGIERSCARLRCDAVLAGRVRRRGGVKYQLTVTVVSARGGKVIGSVQARARGRRGLSRAAKGLAEPVMRLIDQTQPAQAETSAAAVSSNRATGSRATESRATESRAIELSDEPVEVVGEPAESKPPTRSTRTPRTPPTRTSRNATPPPPRAGAIRDSRSAQDASNQHQRVGKPGGVKSSSTVSTTSRPAVRDIFEVYAAVGVSTRSFTLTSVPERRYKPIVFSEFTVGGEFYPLALVLENFAKYIGVAANYSRPIAIGTELPADSRVTTCGFDEQVETSSQQLIGDVKLRWPLPIRWTPEVSASVGFGFRDFTLGRNNVMPSFKYRFLHVGLGARVPLGTPLIALDVAGDVRPLLSTGQESVDSFGKRPGGLGWAIRAGLSGRLNAGVIYFAQLEYLRFSMEFEGIDPAEFPLRECTPDTAKRSDGAPLSGSDILWRGWIGVGYAL